MLAADHYRTHRGCALESLPPPTGRRAAVVGAGPAGLAVAEELAKKGHQVTLFDSWPEPGGVLLYGIPNFKMQKEILDAKLEFLWQLGIKFIGNTFVGRDVTIDELFEQGYQAVFLAHGASLGNRLEAPGVELPGVIMATEFLVRGNLQPEQLPEAMRAPLTAGERVLVIGAEATPRWTACGRRCAWGRLRERGGPGGDCHRRRPARRRSDPHLSHRANRSGRVEAAGGRPAARTPCPSMTR